MNDGMEQAQRLTQARGAAAVGFISALFSSFTSVLSIFRLSFVSGDEG